MSDWPSPDDRPSGILRAGRRFSVEKFVAWTAAISIGGGVGIAAWSMLDKDDEEPEPEPAHQATTDAAVEGTTTGETPAAPDVGAPRLDLGGPPRLDIPEPWWVDPSQAPSEEPGPEVEVPNW